MAQTYEIVDNKTGQVYEITGDRPPLESEVEELIQSTLPKPSIEERVLANTLYTGNDARRRAFLQNKLGKNPNEPGKSFNPLNREFWADLAETGIGQGAKLAGQIKGATLGAAGGALTSPVTGPVGSIAGGIGGAAIGRGAVQGLAENYARLRGMDLGTTTRVPAEMGAGAATQALGEALSGTGKLIMKTPLLKKWNEFALTNLTRMTKPMQEWISGKWTKITDLAKTPTEAFTKMYDKAYGGLRTLFGKQDKLGAGITKAKNELLYPPGNKPAMIGLSKQVEESVAKYRPNITSNEAGRMLAAARTLESLGGDVIEQAPTKEMLAAQVAVGQKTAEQAAEVVTREVLEAQYQKALDTVVGIGRRAGLQKSTSLGSLAKEVNAHINEKVVSTSAYSTLSQQLDDLGSMLSEGTLKDPVKRDQAMKWLAQNLFNPESIEGNKAFEGLLSKHLGKEFVDNIKDLATAYFARDPHWLSSVSKLAAVPFVTGGVGAGIGYLTGGQEGMVKGRNIGAGLGLAAAAPYVSPAFAAFFHRGAEKLGSSVLNRTALQVLERIPTLAASPLAAMLKDTEAKFGIQVSEEDLGILKARTKEK